MAEAKFRIVEAIYPGMTQLDFTAPHTVFTRIPGAQTIVASEPGGEIVSDGGLRFAGTTRLAEIDRCDLLFFPGGFAATEAACDAAFMAEAKRLGAGNAAEHRVRRGEVELGHARIDRLDDAERGVGHAGRLLAR